ncbi:MAG: secretin N-terminal domain-containing protein [Phycisphaerales bacterium]
MNPHARFIARSALLAAFAGVAVSLVGCADEGDIDTSAAAETHRGQIQRGTPAGNLQVDRTRAVRSPSLALGAEQAQQASRSRVAPVDITLPDVGYGPDGQVAVGIDVPVQRDLDVTLNFKAAPLQEVVREIFENVLNLDYAISPNVADTAVSFVLEGRVGYEELFRTLDSVLGMYGVALQVSNGLVQVLPDDAAKRGIAGPIVRGIDADTPTPLTLSTYIVPLTNIKPEDAATTLKDMLTPRGVAVKGPAGTNVLLLVESPANAPRIVQLLRELDKPFFARRSIRLYTPTNIAPEDLATELNSFASRLGVKTGAGEDVQFAAAAMPRSGQVMVTTTLPVIIPAIDEQAERLDVQIDSETVRRYVYRAQRLSAETLSQAVTSAFSDLNNDAPVITVVTERGASGGLGSIADAGPTGGSSATTRQDPTQQTRTQRGSSSGSSSSFSSAGGRDNGTLIIRAKHEVYKQVKELLDLLDAAPRQVYLQVVVAEVTITGDVQFGVELFTQQGLGDGDIELRSANNLVDVATGSAFYLAENAFALVEAAQSKGDVRVLDAPYLYTVSGNTASLEVGVDQPVITQFISGGVDAVDPTRQSNQIEYRQTGIVLNVTPVVNDRGEIEINLRQEVSSVEQPASNAVIQSPAFPNRIIQTTIVVPNGETAVIGGNRNERDELQRSKTPLLGDIPLVGLAFQGKDVRRAQSELVVLITPTIVITPHDAMDLSRQMLSSVVNIDLIDQLLEPKTVDENELLWR